MVWHDTKPSRPYEKVMVLDTKYSGKKFEEKLEDLRKELDKKKSVGIVICRPFQCDVFETYANTSSYARRDRMAIQFKRQRVKTSSKC
jgi:hypothetical protein